ncbi:vanillate O-demethylase monooxygenase subunit [Sphingobium sp. AP50]|uniref:aromatic ring-hydroxylating dioxygenase subunit alpha n=1 Tax=Sphingobium sp. AP50 TaxID=1884369 RepID=UPI0008C5BA5F|nr:aromatic ring-hydroxylating dioxygenase subunit alpha [Sphingobium sp. AP50]SEJ99001.1 vanillate O-demethylase monooxygenase subunit [Sphingobium sp. AP50]
MTNGDISETQRNPYLYNSWYCAGWAHDLGDQLIVRTMLDIPVLLYRTQAGIPVAIKDECPHRFAPLSMGHREGDDMVCPYHGLKFNTQGMCIDARYSDRGREGPCLRTFPLIERQNILWIWMGDPNKADADEIVDYPFFDNPVRLKFYGTTYLNANYELENDNLLDLSHLDYVHRNSIAQDLSLHGAYSAQQDGNCVSSIWYGENVPIADHFLPMFDGEPCQVDTWMKMHWMPASALKLDTGVKRTGAPMSEAIGTLQGHFVTPETATTSHYFWGLTLHPAFAEAGDIVRQATTQAFEDEDRPLIEAVQRRMGKADFWSKRPIILRDDGGAIRARRLLDRLIKAEMSPPVLSTVAAE